MNGAGTAGLEIRPPREEEFHEILEIANLGFGEETSAEDEEGLRSSFPFDRALCAYDAGRVVGTLGVYSLELTLPGRTALPAGGVTWGGTLPTHRRRGILRALMKAHLEDMVRRGEPLSVLLASEASIYRRFGFGPATTVTSFSIDRAYAAFVSPVRNAGPRGITLLADVEVAERLASMYEVLRLDQPGAVSRSSGWWTNYLRDPVAERQGATKMYHAVHAGPDGAPDGYVSYRIKERWVVATPMYEAQVVELIAGNPEAYRALWHYVLGTDLCQTISCQKGHADEPLRLLLADSRRLTVNAVADDLYVRLLDIPRALRARSYGAAGEVVLEVSETFPTARTGKFALRAETGRSGATCRATDEPADILLSVDALAAAYLGGATFTNLALAGQATAKTPEAFTVADAMFSWGIAPYCGTMF
jgi:predicted acetyltransferase